jgi:hypothetical protein
VVAADSIPKAGMNLRKMVLQSKSKVIIGFNFVFLWVRANYYFTPLEPMGKE